MLMGEPRIVCRDNCPVIRDVSLKEEAIISERRCSRGVSCYLLPRRVIGDVETGYMRLSGHRSVAMSCDLSYCLRHQRSFYGIRHGTKSTGVVVNRRIQSILQSPIYRYITKRKEGTPHIHTQSKIAKSPMTTERKFVSQKGKGR